MAIYREQCAERSAIALYSVDFGADSHYSGEFAEPAHSIRVFLARDEGGAKRGEAKRSEARRDGTGKCAADRFECNGQLDTADRFERNGN